MDILSSYERKVLFGYSVSWKEARKDFEKARQGSDPGAELLSLIGYFQAKELSLNMILGKISEVYCLDQLKFLYQEFCRYFGEKDLLHSVETDLSALREDFSQIVRNELRLTRRRLRELR